MTKSEAVFKLFRAEMTYLIARGWDTLLGHPDEKYYVPPGVDYKADGAKLCTHEEALAIQKEKDKSDE